MTDTIKSFSLKGSRNEFDYSQEQIAEKLGVSRAQYIAWETGKVVPKHMVVYALAYIYGINADLLRVSKKNLTLTSLKVKLKEDKQ
ncbi:helix-turn-helix domain-containing protein [Staphylococcus pseudintermedius]|nr:helix-turn-helix domain-containing protein [Staphylococcus pseudintermedius]